VTRPSEVRKPRIFYRSAGTDETWCYAGTLTKANSRIANYLSSDLPELADGETAEIEVKRMDMTDLEDKALPDL
jgi:hypothetical protein